MLRSRLARSLLVLAAALGLVLVPGSAQAAGETASRVDVDAQLAIDGSLVVRETISFDAEVPETVVQRLAGQREGTGDTVYTFTITGIGASADGKDLAPAINHANNNTTITVKPAGARVIVISYTVTGATTRLADGSTQFQWRVLQGLSLNVVEVSGVVRVPADAVDYRCQAGAPGAEHTCGLYSGGTHNSRDLSFNDGPRGVGEVVEPGLRFPEGQVAVTEQISHRWSLDRAFTPGWPQLLSALGVLLVGGLALLSLHRRAGRDILAPRATTVAEFQPAGENVSTFVVTDEVRPAHVGTVSDEHVDPLDVVGSVLDLAVRGHLLITQLPPQNGFVDWSLTRTGKSPDALADFEQRLLDAVGDTTVSSLAASVAPAVKEVQEALYRDVVRRGWFSRRPDRVRRAWSRWGWIGIAVAIAATALLVALTTYGLVGLALIAVALGLMLVAQEMPARTAAGSSLLAGLRALAVQLDTQPTSHLPKGQEYREVSRILPYAVVLGGWDRWLEALVAADDDEGTADPTDLAWYHAPDDWHLQQLPASLDAFVNAVRGRLFAR